MNDNRPLWADRDGPALPVLEGDHIAEVCVVGLGGSGLTCALELARIGASVVAVDAQDVGAGAAGRNGGFLLAGLAPFYHDARRLVGDERARTIYQLTLDELDRIEADTPDTITRNGSLRLASSDEEMADCERHLLALRTDGFSAEPYDGPEGRGLLLPGDGTFQPLERCRQLAQMATHAGARLFVRSPVRSFGNGEVRSDAGAVRAKHVIVAVDGQLERLLPELAGEVRTARLQMLATAPTSKVKLTRPVYARWGYDYWQQRPDGAIALGGARDVGGEGEWTTDTSPSDVVQQALEQCLRETVGVDAPVTHRWGASVGYTDDGMPIVREVRDRVWAAGGYSGTGNVIGALLGRGLARAIVKGDRTLIAPFLRA